MNFTREIIFYKDYFENFFKELPEKVRQKIDEVLFMVTIIERVPVKFLKSIKNSKGLYEIRVESSGNIYRIFCCFDKGNLVVLFNGFQKKSQKLPKNELQTAQRLMKEYFENQKLNNDANK
ncbi:MAG: type II toxin-antitoxin system RelE/ParE family toxin [Bacteroidia bacterium]|nr:type II toxin-antitoxin system RelE/ParE family toxin [Bacteroidia bacterium]